MESPVKHDNWPHSWVLQAAQMPKNCIITNHVYMKNVKLGSTFRLVLQTWHCGRRQCWMEDCFGVINILAWFGLLSCSVFTLSPIYLLSLFIGHFSSTFPLLDIPFEPLTLCIIQITWLHIGGHTLQVFSMRFIFELTKCVVYYYYLCLGRWWYR